MRSVAEDGGRQQEQVEAPRHGDDADRAPKDSDQQSRTRCADHDDQAGYRGVASTTDSRARTKTRMIAHRMTTPAILVYEGTRMAADVTDRAAVTRSVSRSRLTGPAQDAVDRERG